MYNSRRVTSILEYRSCYRKIGNSINQFCSVPVKEQELIICVEFKGKWENRMSYIKVTDVVNVNKMIKSMATLKYAEEN